MESLKACKEVIHSCSKCGLCQSVCPIYKITGNDCTVSRGFFIMLYGLIKNELRMTKSINKYLDLCLKCGACSKFCPSGIDVVDIVSLAKAEYLKNSKIEKIKLAFLKYFILGFLLKLAGLFKLNSKSKTFDKKVIYFGGCAQKLESNKHIIKIMNSLNIEVITPNFDCCGIPLLVRGDIDSYKEQINKFAEILDKYETKDIITTCASCEKALKSYKKWGCKKDYNVKNIYEYIKESGKELELKKSKKVTFHKPCNINNYDDIKWILNHTKNLNYIEMKDYDKCCGLNGITKFKEYKILSKIFKEKHNNILSTKANIVLTSCLGCKFSLLLHSAFRYRVKDFTEFLAQNLK